MSMLNSFCTSHALVLRDTVSEILVSEAIYRSLKYRVSKDIKRDAGIGIFSTVMDNVTPSVIQALDSTSLYHLVKYHYGVTETQIDRFIDSIVVSTAKDLLLSSYKIYCISFPYKNYLEFISYGLTNNSLKNLGLERLGNMGVLYSTLGGKYKNIFDEVTLAVNAYYAIEGVANELHISTDEAKQKILYIISDKSSSSIFKEYYENILGTTRSVPSTSVCKVIRPYLFLEEV